MKYPDYITMKDLAGELKMDRSNLRKYVKRLGIQTFKIRIPEAGNQISSAVSIIDAKTIKKERRDAGYINHPLDNVGWFYVVIPDPNARPGRIKLGYTISIDNRLKDYRTTNPEVVLYMKKECKQVWEQAAIYAITNFEHCRHVGGEVYDAWNPDYEDDPLAYIRERCDGFFKFFEEK